MDNAPRRSYNWVTLGILDLEEIDVRRYTAGWVLRLIGWNADSQRFIFTYSPFGGPNPVVKNAAVGDVCQSPIELVVPPDQMVMQTTWIDRERFVIYTAPSDGIPDRYSMGMFFYDLRKGVAPVLVDEILQDYGQVYGTRIEMVVLDQETVP